MDPEQISCPDVPTEEVLCPDCGGQMETISLTYSGTSISFCKPCSEEKERKAEDERIKFELKRSEDAKQAQIIKRLEQCNIGHRFKGMTFADYKPTCEKSAKVKQQCESYTDSFADDSGRNILMIGSPGTGKNMLSAIIGQELIKQGHTSLHTTAMKLVRKIKDTWRNKEESEQSAIDMFVAPSMLVIDEIGVQFGSQTEQLFLTEVINERYERKRPTVLISNLKMSQIVEVMGERAIDRFYDNGSLLLVFDWESYRRRPN